MAGLWTMIRLILRRDRIKLPLTAVITVATLIAMIPLLNDTYGDTESIEVLYSTMGMNPAMLFMTGPIDAATFGSLVTIETLLWWGIAFAIINTLLVVRHTRHNEEIGAQELLLSGQLHRASNLVAVLIVALGLNALIALGIGAGFELVNDGYWATSSSWLYGVAMGVFGFVWACIAAVVVQLVESGRSANGMLMGLIGATFVARGIGDFMGKIGESGLHEPTIINLFNPYGWLQATRPLSTPDWAPLWISIGVALVVAMLGFMLLARRDVGAGLLPSRKGHARASRLLVTPLGLTWKLQKNIFIGWFIGIMVMVATIGSLVPQMNDVMEQSESMSQVLTAIGGVGELLPSFMAAMMAISCLLVFGYTIHALGKVRSEEASGHLENLLATKLSRLKWLGGHVALIACSGVIMLALVGAVLAGLSNLLADTNLDVVEYTVASLSYLPMMLAFMALYLLLFGLSPRLASGVTWLYFGFTFFALWLGPMLQLDQWVMNLSIMEHVSTPPVEEIIWGPLLFIALVAFALIVLGFGLFRQRNIG